MQYSLNILGVFAATFLLCANAHAASPAFSEKPTIVIAADEWCPVNCKPGDENQGVGVDLAKAIFEPLGYKVDYRIMPWTEALEKVREGSIDAVVGADHTDEPTLIFPSRHILNVSDDFYVQKGDSWRYQGMHTLKGKKLGVIRDYGYNKAISDYIAANHNNVDLVQESEGDDALSINIKKLMNRKINVLVESRPVMEYNIAKMRMYERIVWAGGTEQLPIYVAFSPARTSSKGLAAHFDAGMRKLEKEGRLEAFYHAYGLRTGLD